MRCCRPRDPPPDDSPRARIDTSTPWRRRRRKTSTPWSWTQILSRLTALDQLDTTSDHGEVHSILSPMGMYLIAAAWTMKPAAPVHGRRARRVRQRVSPSFDALSLVIMYIRTS